MLTHRSLLAGILAFATVGLVANIRAIESTALKNGFACSETDWPWWRGNRGDGHATEGQRVPTEWNESRNILWKSPVSGRGYGSPIVVNEMVLLQTADESVDSQSVVCFDRTTGMKLWETIVHSRGGMRKNKKSTAASSTPAWDGERFYVNFANSDAVIATALDLKGKILWQQEISSYVNHQGFGSSPTLYQALVLFSSDNKGGGAVVALDRISGKIVWKRERAAKANYTSPTVLHAAGRDQLVMIGCDQVVSYDPLTGNTLWEIDGATTECVTSTITDGLRIFTSGGYPKNHISAIRADGSSILDWEIQDRVYVPSMLHRDGYLYGVLDAGIAACWKAADGEEVWKERLGGTFSASLVLADDHIYAVNEAGETFIYRADPSEFKLVAKNQLGDEVLATPAIVGSRIYYRATQAGSDPRQEWLYCIGFQ